MVRGQMFSFDDETAVRSGGGRGLEESICPDKSMWPKARAQRARPAIMMGME